MSGARFEKEAVRVTDWGTERAFFLGSPGDQVFSVVHEPGSEPKGAVLVCGSLFTDTIFNYRREVEVARDLAADGFLVGRFHYRGTGQSEGDPLEVTQETMVEDALRLAGSLAGLGGETPGVLGSRWGALVAAGVAARFDAAPLALWEPVIDGGAFLKEALQASGVAHLASQLEGPSPKESLASRGVANILGFPMGRALYESGRSLALVDLLGTRTGPVLYLGPAKGDSLARTDRDAVEALRGNGLSVTAEVIAGPRAWWFVDEVNPTPLDAAATTAQWFHRSLVEAP